MYWAECTHPALETDLLQFADPSFLLKQASNLAFALVSEGKAARSVIMFFDSSKPVLVSTSHLLD